MFTGPVDGWEMFCNTSGKYVPILTDKKEDKFCISSGRVLQTGPDMCFSTHEWPATANLNFRQEKKV